jgi:desulfoferrodoxin (superoxide reductase-like protein)
MENLYGQIELTQLGEIIKANPSSVKIVTDKNGVQRKYLNPGDAPLVKFPLGGSQPLAVYAFCNLHGLWKAQL